MMVFNLSPETFIASEKDLERIKIYCQKDTLTVAQLLLRYKVEELIKEENIEFA